MNTFKNNIQTLAYNRYVNWAIRNNKAHVCFTDQQSINSDKTILKTQHF